MDVLCQVGKSQLCPTGGPRGHFIYPSDKECVEGGIGITEKLSGPRLTLVRNAVTVPDSLIAMGSERISNAEAKRQCLSLRNKVGITIENNRKSKWSRRVPPV